MGEAKQHATTRQDGTPKSASSKPRRAYAKWRVASLVTVHLLFLAHFLHWKISGKTLAPLEFSEVMQTLNAGILTAGFLFMLLALLSVFLLGRFFCSWLCHMVAIQDLCAWLLKKLGFQPKPIRSRLLLFVPTGVMFYMFVVPFLRRLVTSVFPETSRWIGVLPPFEIQVTSNTEGFASFITDDFWRNLPEPFMAIITLLICGGLLVYFLGTRSFCLYACPYGALFGVADRFAVGQTLLTGNCIQCAKCTAACPSQVRVHEEVIRYGKVIDPGCFKDLDCITVCPEEALSFGFNKPRLIAPPTISEMKSPRGKKYDFSLGEECALFAIFSASLAVFVGLPDWLFRGAEPLYSQVSLFLGLVLAVLTSVVVIYLFWLVRREAVRFQRLTLKRQGQIQRSGKVFIGVSIAWLLLVGDSMIVQYHTACAARAVELTKQVGPEVLRLRPVGAEMIETATLGLQHLDRATVWGIFTDPRTNRRRAWLALVQGDLPGTISCLRESILREPHDPDTYYQLARVLAVEGKFTEAASLFYQTEQLCRESHRLKDAVLFGPQQLAALGMHFVAIRVLEEAIKLHPSDARPLRLLNEYRRIESNAAKAERLIQPETMQNEFEDW